MAKKTGGDGGLWETIKTLFWALLLAGLIRTLLFQPFWIPSGSMKSTLLIGDFLFVNKFAYGYSWASCPTIGGFDFCGFAKDMDGRVFGGEPERGDIVVFKHPKSETDYIKRLIGLPGDTVQIKDGVLYINGTVAPQESIGVFTETKEHQGPMGNIPQCSNEPVSLGADCDKLAFTETLPNGVSHTILNISNRVSGDNTPEYVVPAGEYFFMGDNRDNSLDSRFSQSVGGVGFVPASYLIGRADRVIFSSGGGSMLAFWTWRKDRFFEAVE